MTTTIISINNPTNIPIDSYSAISACQIEVANGIKDIGFVSWQTGSIVDFTLNVAAAGSYVLSLGLASISPASLNVFANGTQIATFAVSGNAWQVYKQVTQVITLPSGIVDLQIKSVIPTMHNLQTISLTPQTVAAVTVTVASLQAKIAQTVIDLQKVIANLS